MLAKGNSQTGKHIKGSHYRPSIGPPFERTTTGPPAKRHLNETKYITIECSQTFIYLLNVS